ncbi:MAG: putative acetyltransferase [Candidatus Paceibacteria bacterium]|jgi:predicted acetyltransferase
MDEEMREFRLLQEEDIDAAVRMVRDAFPAAGLPDPEEHADSLAIALGMPDSHTWGVFESGRMLGTMRTHDFVMNAFGQQIPVQGLGGVAVGLCDKKRKVARDMVRWFLQRSWDEGAAMTSLYPFLASFYERMGWGVGTPMHRFQLEPSSFPKRACEGVFRNLGEPDRESIRACYSRMQSRTHGMFQLDARSLDAIRTDEVPRVIGVEFDGRLEAYILFQFEALKGSNMLLHDLIVTQWTYESQRGLHGLLGFLRNQADQVRRVTLLTQDRHLHHLFTDPLDGSENHIQLNHQISERGSGIMYRVIDPARLLEQLADHNFGDVDLICGIDLKDGFWEKTSARVELQVERGRARIVKGAPASTPCLKISVSDFSSLVMGVVPLGRLLDYGLAELSAESLREPLEAAFKATEAPRCTTRF